jgi:hypothetical protein
MREFHGEAACDTMGAGADSQADATDRQPGNSRGQDRVIVQDADTRIALVLAYRERVGLQNVAGGRQDAPPEGDHDRDSRPVADADGGREPYARNEQDGDPRDGKQDEEKAEGQHKAGRATPDDLPARARDMPAARDVLPNIRLAELDDSKLGGYSLNPDHPGNDGKANGWRALGYDVDSREGRHDATRELGGLLRNELLVSGKVEKTRDTEYGPSHTVLSGFTGPNGRHATVVSCWLIEDREGVSVPKLTTTWAQPHRDKESGR